MTAHLAISGRVQGVSYRASTQQRARELGLTGWVRNLPDGTVEVQASGSRDALESLVTWCHEGPAHAQVADVRVAWIDGDGGQTDFEVRR